MSPGLTPWVGWSLGPLSKCFRVVDQLDPEMSLRGRTRGKFKHQTGTLVWTPYHNVPTSRISQIRIGLLLESVRGRAVMRQHLPK